MPENSIHYLIYYFKPYFLAYLPSYSINYILSKTYFVSHHLHKTASFKYHHYRSLICQPGISGGAKSRGKYDGTEQ